MAQESQLSDTEGVKDSFGRLIFYGENGSVYVKDPDDEKGTVYPLLVPVDYHPNNDIDFKEEFYF